jgi:L-ribulose-5-phosphate 3-epimerase
MKRASIDRRSFLKTAVQSAALAGVAASGTPTYAAEEKPEPMKIKKSLKYGMVEVKGSLLENFKMLKAIGFDGVELGAPNDLKREEVLAARDASGLVINGVVHALQWSDPLSHPDAAIRKKSVDAMEAALRDAKAYGATSVLLVPAVVNKEISYQDAYKRSQVEIRKMLPLAKELDVIIAIENVWNNFLLSPLEMARYVDEFESPYMRVHFDVGNVLRYGWPEQWIRVLGKRIFKLDIKEYSLKKQADEGLWKGFNVEIGEGDCDWPAVMKALREIKYIEGWGAAEVPGGDRARLEDISRRMDKVFAA